MKFKRFLEVDNDNDIQGIEFDNGDIVTHYHSQDCCEHVYADWQAIDESFFEDEFDAIRIEVCKKYGFRLNGYFIPCYNIQNGYYSSDLIIITETYEYNRKGKLAKKIQEYNVIPQDAE